MPLWASWTGWLLTILFGLLSVYQAIAERQSRRTARAAKEAVNALRMMCSEAIGQELLANDAGRYFAVSVIGMADAIESNINAIVGLDKRKG